MWYLVLVALLVGLGGVVYIGYRWGARAAADGKAMLVSAAKAEADFKELSK